MKRIKFESYPDVTSESLGNPLTILLRGGSESLNSIKKKLTIRNKSVRWNVERLYGMVAMFTRKMEFFRPEDQEYQDWYAKIAKIRQDIKDLQASEITELYEQTAEGLEVPAGFWYLAKQTDGSNLNSNLQPYCVPGLRDYQIEALTSLFKYKRAGLCLFTGAGKSRIITSICIAGEKSGLRTCVVVPTEYLVGQMMDTIKEYTESVCGMGGGRKFKLGVSICVTTAQSAMHIIDNFDVIVIDESQHLAASTWTQICSSSKATHLYSLSGTPYRSDGLDLIIHAFSGPIVYEKATRWGIENGWLKPVRIYLKTIDYVVDGRTKFLSDSMNAQKAYKTLATSPAVMLEIRTQLEKLIAADRRVIVLFKTVAPCVALQKFCKGVVEFSVASSAYKKPIDDFRDGKTNILVSNSSLIAEGLDVPNANALIMVTQSSSEIITNQALGRVLRKSEGFALVIDITTSGYQKFLNAQEARAKVYKTVTDDVFNIGDKK